MPLPTTVAEGRLEESSIKAGMRLTRQARAEGEEQQMQRRRYLKKPAGTVRNQSPTASAHTAASFQLHGFATQTSTPEPV